MYVTKDNTVSGTNILLRSENCTEIIEEKKKSNEKGSNLILGIGSVFVLLVMFLPSIIAILENKKLSQAEPVSLPVILIALIILIVAVFFTGKSKKMFNDVYNKYKDYCLTEVLIADDEKVFGTTMNGQLTLTYSQIDSASIMSNIQNPDIKSPVIPNDILLIKDKVGNEFLFYSFKNCKEFKVIIDVKIKER